MADPRFFELDIGEAEPSAALREARRVLTACAEPPISLWIRGSVSRESITALAELLPGARVAATLTVEPGRLPEVAEVLQDPRISWLAQQKDSRFGSTMSLEADHRAEPAAHPSSAIELTFVGEPGREDEERPRFDQWLKAAAGAGLLPPEARPLELAERFFADMRVPLGQGPPQNVRPLVESGVELGSFGWRGSKGRPTTWGPYSFRITLPLPAAVALARARPLLAAGGTIWIGAYFDIDAELAARFSATFEASFEFHCDDREDLDERAVDGVLASVGTDPVHIAWHCTWPGEGHYLNRVVLLVNATEGPYEDLNHVPGRSALFLSVHPRVNDGRPAEYAAWRARRAGIELVTDPESR